MAIRPRTWAIAIATGAVALASAPFAFAATPSPSPVTNVTVQAGDGAAVVTWRKPASGVAPTSYVVTSTPGNKRCTADAPKVTCKVTGLANGTDYIFTVVAKKGSAQSRGTRSSAATPVSADLTITGTLSGVLRKSDGANCPSSGSNFTIEMRSPGARDAECRLNVVAILADGRMYASAKVASASKSFTIAVPVNAVQREDLTLHIVRANGNYVGPILLATKKVGTKNVGVLGLGDNAKGVEALGVVPLKSVASVTAFAQVSAFKGTQGSVVACLAGAGSNLSPAGAGKGGYVKKVANCTGATKSSRLRAVALPMSVESSCQQWAMVNQGSTGLDQGCYNAMKTAWGTSFSSTCPVSAIGKTMGQLPQACADFIMTKLNGNGNGDGNGDGNGNGNNGGGESDPCAASSSGGDQDNDGIPSAVDVDDNGNGIVDISDPAVDGDCTVEPSKAVRTRIGDTWTATGNAVAPVNYAAFVDGIVTESQFNDMLDELLSGDNFGIGYYIFKTDFFPGAYKDDGVMPAVWVTCAGVVWCDPATSRATLGTNVDMYNAEGIDVPVGTQNWFQYGYNLPWSAPGALDGSNCSTDTERTRNYHTPCWSEIDEPLRFGSAETSCNGNDSGQLHYDPTFTAPAQVPDDASNFLWTTVCDMNGMLRSVSGGGLAPNLGQLEGDVAASDAISAFDILTLNYLSGTSLSNAGVSSIATTLGAYPITAPMIRSFNGVAVDYAADLGDPILGSTANGTRKAVVLNGTDNTSLTIVFNRPQREAFPGEASSSGLHDLHGMNYGIEFEIGNAQLGCGASNGSGGAPTASSAYTVNSAVWNVRPVNGTYANVLAPLRDDVQPDPADEQPGVNTLSLTLDVVRCIQDRAQWLWNDYGIDVADLNLPGDRPLDGSASNWKSETGLQNNGDTSCVGANINARGEDRTGGTDSAIQTFCLQFAPGTFTSPQQ